MTGADLFYHWHGLGGLPSRSFVEACSEKEQAAWCELANQWNTMRAERNAFESKCTLIENILRHKGDPA